MWRRVLGVSRSQLTPRLGGTARPPSSYTKVEDIDMLSAVRAWVDERPTYGYRRITALLNRERLKTGLPRVNHRRIYRLMPQRGMLLQRYTGEPPRRAHDGKVMTIKPNLRWTSDHFEIPCWNSEVVRVAFALDISDREAMAWSAGTGGVTGEMIRDLMVESIEHRFGSRCNGSLITAAVIEALKLSTSPCRSAWCRASHRCAVHSRMTWRKPSWRPLSAITCMFTIPDAKTVLSQLTTWFEDYNESHPHKACACNHPVNTSAVIDSRRVRSGGATPGYPCKGSYIPPRFNLSSCIAIKSFPINGGQIFNGK